MNDDIDEMRAQLEKDLIEHPENFWITRSDVLIQDLVTSTIVMATKNEDFNKHESWAHLGNQNIMDASRLILKKEYDDMSKALGEIQENPENVHIILNKYFPSGLIQTYDYESINYKEKIDSWEKS